MTPSELSSLLSSALNRLVERGAVVTNVPDEISVERPRQSGLGDYATNIAMRLAKSAGMAPRELAQLIADELQTEPQVRAVDIAGPGFLNITLEAASMGALAGNVIAAADKFGTNESMLGSTVNLEFVSANPTGPVTLASARWAAVGDALARTMRASGATVSTEYYFNDAGSQIDRFSASLLALAAGKPVADDGYHGAYVAEVAEAIVADSPQILVQSTEAAQEEFRVRGIEKMWAMVRQSLADFGVIFDVYFSERDLHTSGSVAGSIKQLRSKGYVYDKDDASWLKTTEFGDDKDRVLVRGGGEPTYFAADVAYYLNKRERGFDKVVIILGADHHGYIGRMQAMVACTGDDPDQTLEILIGQMVTLMRGAELVKMSKRAGDFVTLDDLVEAVGADAARYALARSSMDSRLEIDLDVWSRKTSDNPVFYVQYAHARLASLARHAADLGISRGTDYDRSLLTHEREVGLLGVLGEFPRVVSSAAELREIHRIARYAESLASAYHKFYDVCRVLPMGEDPATELTVSRLWLCEATRVVLANALRLLGVSAPEQM
ncbi:MAG: arginine--tRNA ligase [Antricoccus sp.]